MIISKFNAKFFGITSILILVLSIVSFGQNKEEKPTVLYGGRSNKQMPVAERNNVYCAGYIQTAPISTNFKIVGADTETEQYVYAQDDLIYINQGVSNGVKVGDVYSVVRPRGQVKSKFSNKGKLGFYVQEVGAVEVVRVKDSVSIARVKTSCEDFLLGDLLQPWETRVAPMHKERPALDTFAESSGKATGRIVMARDARESLSRDQIVYIDLGAEDNVKQGDYLTIFRSLGKTKIIKTDEEEDVRSNNSDYGSDTFKGSTFSIMSPRNDGGTAEGKIVTTKKAKSQRPAGLRKIVGEMIILSVKERTATALIIRNAQEIHTGDLVEIQ